MDTKITIRFSSEEYKKINDLKVSLGFKTLSDVIRSLLKDTGEITVVSTEPVEKTKEVKEVQDLIYKTEKTPFAANEAMAAFWAGKAEFIPTPVESPEVVKDDLTYDESI